MELHYLASLAKARGFKFNERVESYGGRHVMLISGLHMWIHTHTHNHYHPTKVIITINQKEDIKFKFFKLRKKIGE